MSTHMGWTRRRYHRNRPWLRRIRDSRELKASGRDIAGTLVGLRLELDHLIRAQAGQARAFDVFQMHEHVLAAIVRDDEAVTPFQRKKNLTVPLAIFMVLLDCAGLAELGRRGWFHRNGTT